MSIRKNKPRIVEVPVPRKSQPRNSARPLTRQWKRLRKAMARWMRKVTLSRPVRRLQVLETVSLGEKRLIAVVQFEQQRFLVGASGPSMSLLSSLEQNTRFAVSLADADERVRP